MLRTKAMSVCAGLLAAANLACAQDFPNRPVRMIVPYPSGGGTDLIARVIGKKLTEKWGQSVVDKVYADTAAVLNTDEVKVLLAHEGAQIAAGDPEAFAAYINAEMKKWSRIIADANPRIPD